MLRLCGIRSVNQSQQIDEAAARAQKTATRPEKAPVQILLRRKASAATLALYLMAPSQPHALLCVPTQTRLLKAELDLPDPVVEELAESA